MNYLNTAALLVAAYLIVFFQASVDFWRDWFGAQIDIIPALMVYCGLNSGLATLTLTAAVSGLCLDSLSANPLGVSVLSYFVVGFVIYQTRDIILRDQPYARFILGVSASAIAPVLTVLFLWGGGFKPLIGWGSLLQWLIVALCGGALTPVCFAVFERVHAALSYSRTSESPFRTDREIKRGRN